MSLLSLIILYPYLSFMEKRDDYWFLSFSMIISATFLPLISIPPKIGPMRGVPDTAEAAIPQT